MSTYLVGMLFSAWAAVEGYEMTIKHPEDSMWNGFGNIMLIVGTVLFIVDIIAFGDLMFR